MPYLLKIVLFIAKRVRARERHYMIVGFSLTALITPTNLHFSAVNFLAAASCSLRLRPTFA
jgi:hypothetical protein